jgi:hypothetical protein
MSKEQQNWPENCFDVQHPSAFSISPVVGHMKLEVKTLTITQNSLHM